MNTSSQTLITLVTLGLAACGTSPGATDATGDVGSIQDVGMADVGTADTATPDAADVGSPDAPTADIEDVAPDPVEDTSLDADADAIEPDATPQTLVETCEAACEARQDPNSGGCPVSLEQECDEWCIEIAPNVETALEDAFFECLAADPLCFQTMLQCALSLAYPEPFPHTLTLRGTGFDEWEGDRVFAAVEESAGEFVSAEAVIQDGAFEVSFDVVMHVSQSHLTLFYIDANGNGACDADIDETGSESIELWGLPDDALGLPDWLLEASPDPATNMGFVCDFID